MAQENGDCFLITGLSIGEKSCFSSACSTFFPDLGLICKAIRLIPSEFKTMGKISSEERKEKWQFLSNLKNKIETEFNKSQDIIKKEQINQSLKEETIDISTPWIKLDKWFFNLLAKTRREMEEIFKSMWFHIEYWHDVVSKYENFYSVNIPSSHPATEMHDTFYLNQTEEDWNNFVFRTHTSSMQNWLLKKYWTPLKMVLPWKCYRYENTDASHDTVFWQLEWVVIDENISIAHFKDMIKKILSAIFKSDTEIRMRPAFFPFVEPWFEMDASCPICKWKWCSLCQKTWWIEILWAWMMHPNVLKEWWVDTEKYRWFAFWLWLTRLVAIKYWIKDIRLFTNWDLNFLKSF